MENQTNFKNVDYKEMEIVFEDELIEHPTYTKKEDLFKSEIDKEVYLSFDVTKNKAFKNFTAMSWAELKDQVRNDNHMYEIIRTDRPRYSYFDIEGSYTQVNKHYNIDDMNQLEDKIIVDLKLAIEDFKYNNDKDEDTDLVVLSASNNAKLSLHVIDKNIILSNKDDCKIYHEAFLQHIRNQPELTLIIDNAVYDSDRNFRLVNQSKFSSAPRPIKLKSDHSISDTFITRVDKNTEPMKIPPRWIKTKKVFVKPIKEELDETEETELNMLIEKLDVKRFDSYNDWVVTVWCLFACGASKEQIHFESSSRCPEKYQYESVESTIKQYDHGKSKFNIDTLRAWAKQDSGFEIDRVLDKVPKEQPKARADHFQFLDLLRKYQGKDFYLMDGLDEFCRDISSCVSMVLGSRTTFVMYTNDDNQYDLAKSLPKLKFSITSKIGEKESTQHCELEKYIIDNPLKFPLFNNIVFKPNNVGVKRNDLNIWSGFKGQEVDIVNMDIVNVFINHIREVWANSNEEHYKYIMSWLAQIIKTPEKKTEVVILLQGGQGCGKTLPCDILLEHVFGDNLGMTASGLGSLTQRFNGCTMGKIFSNVNELSVVDGDAFNASFDKMKSLITDRRLQVEKKGLEHIQIDNFNNFIMTTNHVHTVKLERDDRRYACFEVSDKYKQNSNYFADFMDTLDNQNAGDNIYTYFLRYPDNEMVNVRKIPMTEIRKDLLDSCKSNVERFVSQMNDEIDEALLYDWVGKEGENAITCANFYQQYKDWCSANGEKSWSSKAVGSELKNKKLYKGVDRNRRDGRQATYYVF